ncbi:hypothetical protein CFP56_011098 [Quercus suber]|uniref:Uncharacterized protein n=1 Tax=Quercus suber TaxID=58331 RepID=A0AAW0KZD2_QUESU
MVCDDTCPPISSTTSPLSTTHTSSPPTIGATPTDVHGSEDMIFVPNPGLRNSPAPHQSLYTLRRYRVNTLSRLRIGHKGCKGHEDKLLTARLEMICIFIFACVLFKQGEISQGTTVRAQLRSYWIDTEERIFLVDFKDNRASLRKMERAGMEIENILTYTLMLTTVTNSNPLLPTGLELKGSHVKCFDLRTFNVFHPQRGTVP